MEVMDKLAKNVGIETIENNVNHSARHPYWKLGPDKRSNPERKKVLQLLEKMIDVLGKALLM